MLRQQTQTQTKGSRIASPTELAELAMNNGHSLSDAWVMSAIATGIIAERIERDLAAEERRHKWQN